MQSFHDLVGGFHHFRSNYFLKEKEFFEALAHSQNPKTLVIACCDSRTDPAIVLRCKPGDLFVVRSGHSNCGGIAGLFNPKSIERERFINRWVSLACPAVREVVQDNADLAPDEQRRLSEEAAVLLSLENLLSYDWVEEAVQSGSLALHALYYDMGNGSLNVWNSALEDFEAVTK